ADCLAASVVDPVVRLVLHNDAGEYFCHLVDMDGTAHRVPEREPDRVSACWRRNAEDVVNRADNLVRSGDVRRADRGDLHAVLFAVILRLPFVEDFVHRILHMAMPEIVFGNETVAEEFLFPRHRQRTRISNAVDTGEPARLETIIHAENVELERDA